MDRGFQGSRLVNHTFAVTLLPCIDTVADDFWMEQINKSQNVQPSNNAEAEMLRVMNEEGVNWFGIHGPPKKLLKKPKKYKFLHIFIKLYKIL